MTNKPKHDQDVSADLENAEGPQSTTGVEVGNIEDLSISDWRTLGIVAKGFADALNFETISKKAGFADKGALSAWLKRVEASMNTSFHRWDAGTMRRSKNTFREDFTTDFRTNLQEFLPKWDEFRAFFRSQGNPDKTVGIIGTATALGAWLSTFFASHPELLSDPTNDFLLDPVEPDEALTALVRKRKPKDIYFGPMSAMEELEPGGVIASAYHLQWGVIYSARNRNFELLHGKLDSAEENPAPLDLNLLCCGPDNCGPILRRRIPELDILEYLPERVKRGAMILEVPTFLCALGWIRRGVGVGFGNRLHLQTQMGASEERSLTMYWRPIAIGDKQLNIDSPVVVWRRLGATSDLVISVADKLCRWMEKVEQHTAAKDKPK